MGELNSVAGITDIQPLNGFVRLANVGTDGETMSGTVTDGEALLFGDVVYFPKTKATLMTINGNEVCFVKQSDIVFKVNTGE